MMTCTAEGLLQDLTALVEDLQVPQDVLMYH